MTAEREAPQIDLDALREIVEGTAAETGEAFFDQLVRHLARAVRTKCAWVTEWDEKKRRLRALSFWAGDRYVEGYEYAVRGTPCEPVVLQRRLIHVPDRVIELHPDDPDLPPLGAVSYIGTPLVDTDGEVLGHLAVLDDKPLSDSAEMTAIFHIFAGRAAAELRRVRRDRDLRDREQSLSLLREEIDALHGFDEIIGDSPALREVLGDVARVASGDTTVLITGETGTGKELLARAIHARSERADRPLVRVNCAAIPASLQESEFFGHVRGAFTGATQHRDGRFKLADGGTIFLDEVGELPADLQVKLLRVLQEGEFEPVGSSETEKVDVRVIAATNRDLETLVEDGSFRKDLLYRLNVFPLHMPPLRERGGDVVLLAEAFARRLAARQGREVAPLLPEDKVRLQRYEWPGNVRELHNVIERALITSTDGERLNLDRALPEITTRSAPATAGSTSPPGDGRILTVSEMQDFERDNITRALHAANGKIYGRGGAAELLGLNPSTLSSRIKSLGIQRRSGT